MKKKKLQYYDLIYKLSDTRDNIGNGIKIRSRCN